MPSGVSRVLAHEVESMIWVVERLIVYHFLDMGFEILKIPIRVEVDYGLDGSTITSLSKKTLYNLPYLTKQCPKLNQDKLRAAIEQTVEKGLSDHFKLKDYNYNQEPKSQNTAAPK